MRVSVGWVTELVKLNQELDAAAIAERLTMAGLEVEAIDDLNLALRNVVVGAVLEVAPHPRADKLSVCKVDAGDGVRQVVCGAPNVVAGARVALALPGASLLGRSIEAAELRGVASQGMLCSARELGVGDDASGILLLEETATVGKPVAQLWAPDDVVLELGVTPNRPDALSHVGIARELAALTGGRLKVPASAPPERGGPIDDAACVEVKAGGLCPRYACRYLEGVKVAPSPLWLQRRLGRCGFRSINNVVDATNLVLLERGHPLHAFDADRLGRDRNRAAVVVRTAEPGERLRTLDDVDRELDPSDLVICDSERPIALAGIMGGGPTEVTTATAQLLIESAFFQPASIRRSSRRHQLHTESSHRFERGCDPNRGVEDALHRVAQLIAELSGGVIRRGVIDVYPKRIEPRVITFRPSRAASVLGVPPKTVSETSVGSLLGALGLEVAGRDAEAIHFRIPTWRPDLEREIDLIEEVTRLVGMDQITETMPRGSGRLLRAAAPSTANRVETLVRHVLVGAGFDEALSLSFVSPTEDPLFVPASGPPPIRVRNALGEEQSVLRRSLLVRLLSAVGLNQRRGVDSIRLFEIGTVFLRQNERGYGPRPADNDGPPGGDAYAIERTRVAAVATGLADPLGFDLPARGYDFFDLKGVLQALLKEIGHDALAFDSTTVRFVQTPDLPGFHPRSGARVRLGHIDLGICGELHPDIARLYDLRDLPVAFELDLGALIRGASLVRQFKALPRFPQVRRDVALLVGEQISVDDLFGCLSGCHEEHQGLLVDVNVFDIFRGAPVPPGKKSVALAFAYRAEDRTLVDAEVNTIHAKLIEQLVARFQAEVRA